MLGYAGAHATAIVYDVLCLRCAPDAARGAARVAAGLVAAGALHHYGPRDVFAWHPIVASAAIFGLMADGPRPRPDRCFAL